MIENLEELFRSKINKEVENILNSGRKFSYFMKISSSSKNCDKLNELLGDIDTETMRLILNLGKLDYIQKISNGLENTKKLYYKKKDFFKFEYYQDTYSNPNTVLKRHFYVKQLQLEENKIIFSKDFKPAAYNTCSECHKRFPIIAEISFRRDEDYIIHNDTHLLNLCFKNHARKQYHDLQLKVE
ncbi:MAG: hypothetical protein WC413_00860 [Candidatus Nanoarchaeia archaeon]